MTSSLKLPGVVEAKVVVMLDRVEEEMEGDRCLWSGAGHAL